MTSREVERMRAFVATQQTSTLLDVLSSNQEAVQLEIRDLGVGAAAALRLLIRQEIDRRIPVPA